MKYVIAVIATAMLAGCATNGDVEKVQGEFNSYRDQIAVQQAVQDGKIEKAQQAADDAMEASVGAVEVSARMLDQSSKK